jgi:hypothetical protein
MRNSMRACVAALCATSAARRSRSMASTGSRCSGSRPFPRRRNPECRSPAGSAGRSCRSPFHHLPLLLRPLVERARLNQSQRRAQRGQRRAQFVAHRGNELVLHLSRRRRSLTSWKATTMPRSGHLPAADWRCTPPESPCRPCARKPRPACGSDSHRRSACRIGLVDRE